MPLQMAQQRNVEQVSLLSADLQPRYEPNFAWKSAASCLLGLPMLRGAWVDSVNSSGNWYDISGLGKTLSCHGDAAFNYTGLMGYWDYDGLSDYHSRSDEADLDIIGIESYVAAAVRGLTLGGWFRFDASPPAATEYIMSKRGVGGGTLSYYLRHVAGSGIIAFTISNDGIAQVAVSSGTDVGTGWLFVAGRFTPSTELALFFNAGKKTNVVAIPASIFNSAADFNISGYNNGTSLMSGLASHCFLCACALSDAQILSVYQQTRAAFGV